MFQSFATFRIFAFPFVATESFGTGTSFHVQIARIANNDWPFWATWRFHNTWFEVVRCSAGLARKDEFPSKSSE
jgi:hypothetical protein